MNFLKLSAYIAGVFLYLLPGSSFSDIHIKGDISTVTFDTLNNPYTVDDDLFVPEEKKAVIPAGVVFLFQPYTGIIVKGSLSIEGTSDRPVVFTSINNSKYNPQSGQLPNPFDWNGLLITKESSKVIMKNFHLNYSVYGIKSQNPNIVIENGLFWQNGQFHFTINDKIQFVQDNIPFSYNNMDSGSVVTGDNSTKKPSSAHISPLAVTSIISGSACIAAGVVGITQVIKASANYDSAGMAFPDKNRNEEYYQRYRKYYWRSVAAFAGSGVCLGVTTVLLYFEFRKPEKKHVSVFPLIDPTGGLGMSMEVKW